MIRRLAPLGLVLLGIAGMASGQDGPNDGAAMDSAKRITISCDRGGPCVPKPDHLDSWPKKIVVVSLETWDCHIVAGGDEQPCKVARSLPGGSEAVLELHSTEITDHVVRLPVIDRNGGQHGVILPIISLGTTLMAFFIAAWVLFLSWDSTAAAKRQAGALCSSIQELESTVQGIAETLLFPEPPEARQRVGTEPVPPTHEVETLKTEIGEFVKYVKDCFVGLGRVPDETGNKIREMERLEAQVGRQTDTAAARLQYKTLAKTLARLALSATDDDFNKHRKRNPAAEAALESLLDVAGYSLLVPKPLEKYTDGRHVSSSRTEQAEVRNHRGHIARVERRGLLDSNNDVIQKAEVVLYD